MIGIRCYENHKMQEPRTGHQFLLTLMLFILVMSPRLLIAAVKGAFQPPAIDAFILHGESDGDGDGDGVKETHIRRYLNKAGDSVFSMASGEKLWAWSLNTRAGDDSDINSNYVIRDSNCDGIFDEKYGLDEEFHVPECIDKN
jgi:hypothetical protein